MNNDNKNNNTLIINNLSEQGIVYFDKMFIHFVRQILPFLIKKIVLDDLDKLNEQNQQIFYTCINKFSDKVNFLLSTSNIKTDQHILNKVIKLKLINFDYERLKIIMDDITEKENIIIDTQVKKYIIELSNYSVRMLINYLEKFKLMNTTITMDVCKCLVTNISFNTFNEITKLCIEENNMQKAIKILNNLYNSGYSVSDILDNYFFILNMVPNMEEDLKYKSYR